MSGISKNSTSSRIQNSISHLRIFALNYAHRLSLLHANGTTLVEVIKGVNNTILAG